MNKLPTKQIYLLFIIIIGIIALSVYSTYALFTFETTTTDIVSIHTPKSLTISENIYEYQQLIVEPNTVTTTDITIYNSFDYEVCYSLWYKLLGDEEIQNKVQIFEQTSDILNTSGVLAPSKNIKITIVVINDNDSQLKVNIGTIGTPKKDESCSLNLVDDKQIIDSSYKNVEILTTKLLKEKDSPVELETGYLTNKDIKETMTFKDTDKIYVSKEFTYENEMFTLTEGRELTLQEFVIDYSLDLTNTYYCLDDTKCKILYKINAMEKEEYKDEETDEILLTNYHITTYDKLIGYSGGTNGLRQINDKDYIYYGDNPNNYIYYNCENSDNLENCELWRVVGFFYDEEKQEYNTKIVRNESIGSYRFDYKMTDDKNESSNNWNNSTLNKYLNEEYKLKNNYDIYTNKYIQSLERIPNLEIDVKNIKVKEETIDSQITLLSLSDYIYSSSCTKDKINEYTGECFTNNWLYNIEIPKEWTLTSKELEVIEEPIEIIEPDDNENILPEENQPTEEEITPPVEEEKYIINYIYSIGQNITEVDVVESLDVRPVVFLKSRILLLEGNGSFESPYVIK